MNVHKCLGTAVRGKDCVRLLSGASCLWIGSDDPAEVLTSSRGKAPGMLSPGVLGMEVGVCVVCGMVLVVVLIGGEWERGLMSVKGYASSTWAVSIGGVCDGCGRESTREAIGMNGIQNE